MSRRQSRESKRTALRLPMSTSPVARQAQVSPLHAIAPTFHDEDELSNISDDHVVATNLEENLLLEIRTLVKKEKYLEQLEDQLREHGDNLKDSDPSDRGHEELDDDDDEVPSRRVRPRPEKDHSSRTERKKSQDRTGEDATKVKSLPSRAVSNQKVEIAREHYRVCFVEVNPVQLRDIRALVLVSQDLNILHLRTLSKNLFLFSSLQSVNLSDNQLDDSGSKEIRDIMCCPGLQSLDLSRNLLGRLTARTLCERLRHQAKLLSLDLHGNLFFSDGGGEIARLFAKAVAVNEFLLHFSLSVPDQLERSVPLGDQWTNTAARRGPSQVKSKAVRAKTAETTSAATEFSQHLAEQLGQGGKHSSLQSLGLCYAEFSRRAVLNTVKMANRLVALDLSFAFIGIPGAQVVAAALRIDGYATLTQLNMRCNRTKSMGAQAILEALSMNERLTSLDLSHNEIRSDALDVVVELLNCNNVLSRLDLSQNEMIGVETEEELRCLRHAIVGHRGSLSLGQVNSLGATEAQRRELQSALDKNRIANDHDILVSINAVTSSPTDEAAPTAKRLMVSTIVELDDSASFTTVWQRKMTEEGRVSLKWKMAVRTKASASGDAGGASQKSPLVWKLVVNRKCEVRGSIEDEAASARFRFEEQGPSFMLYSAVAYCDEGDTIFLKLGIDQDASDAKHLYKIFVKDIVFIPHHSKDRRHLLVSIPRRLLGSAIQWRMKTQRRMVSSTKDPEVDPVSFLWEGVVQRVYIHTAGAYRLLARVQFPTNFAPTKQETVHMLESRYWWKLQRSSCWDPHTNHVVLEGTYFDMHGAVQRGSDVVCYLPAMEWMAGEYLQLSVTTPSDDVELRVVQFQLFHEVDNWEHPSTLSCLNFTA
ncbi:hypothetical protein PI124_g7228 [Phytophthora idaei]|nr:hypothetical protein PI125_g6805 [Phytophthora idaei]KAG3161234.1 hypothetical protein PI126_g6560 [Phytophthora idaei]KAG3248094.1 hypothetical protein PI124_g7228 [Phytophthora idaei]